MYILLRRPLSNIVCVTAAVCDDSSSESESELNVRGWNSPLSSLTPSPISSHSASPSPTTVSSSAFSSSVFAENSNGTLSGPPFYPSLHRTPPRDSPVAHDVVTHWAFDIGVMVGTTMREMMMRMTPLATGMVSLILCYVLVLCFVSFP